MNKISNDELIMRQSLPLNVKVSMTMSRIRSFYNEFGGDVYISWSGGKDSTVLRDIALKFDSNIKCVYCDTWMEYPEIRQFVKKHDNVIYLKPDKSMKQIIEEDGWCFPSKDVAECIYYARKGSEWALNKLKGLDKNGKPSEYRKQYKKWYSLYESDIKISALCCYDMKEKPIARFEKESGLHPIVALMADESARRKEGYLRTGCNSFDGKRPISKPMGFWTEQDVLRYIKQNSLEIPSVYGEIVEDGQIQGQMCFGCHMAKLSTTGEDRTGCTFCPVGCHLDNFAKFKRLKVTQPKMYEHCMDELGLRDLCSWIDRNIIQKGK